MDIVYKSKSCIVINKPAGVAAQSDLSGDKDAMILTGEHLAALGESSDLWLVHRLDRTVGGLMAFARSKSSAAILSSLISERKMTKEYLAVVDGIATGGVLKDYVYKSQRDGKAYVTDRERGGVKYAELEYAPIETVETPKGHKTLVRVKLNTGRFHQIRVQFASRNMPLTGDGKYGSRDNGGKFPALFSTLLEFKVGKEEVRAELLPNNEYPWSLFGMFKE